MKFSTMFYSVCDLNGMLEVGTFFTDYKIERARNVILLCMFLLVQLNN